MTDVRIGFEVKMQQRFLNREIADQLSPVMRRYFTRAGGAIRVTARNRLRKAPMVRVSQLTEDQKAALLAWRGRYEAGKTSIKPRRPDRMAAKGSSPYTHPRPKSLLKERLFFALSTDKRSVVVGPELIGANKRRRRQGDVASVQELEQGWPFMRPAFEIILPQLPQYLQQAKGS
jgi:hypothetical protein